MQILSTGLLDEHLFCSRRGPSDSVKEDQSCHSGTEVLQVPLSVIHPLKQSWSWTGSPDKANPISLHTATLKNFRTATLKNFTQRRLVGKTSGQGRWLVREALCGTGSGGCPWGGLGQWGRRENFKVDWGVRTGGSEEWSEAEDRGSGVRQRTGGVRTGGER